jgi:hypothetical protein
MEESYKKEDSESQLAPCDYRLPSVIEALS